MEIQPPVMIADPGADADDHKSTYESSNPLEILMNVAFRILRVADMDLLLLIQDFLGQVSVTPYYFSLSLTFMLTPRSPLYILRFLSHTIPTLWI